MVIDDSLGRYRISDKGSGCAELLLVGDWTIDNELPGFQTIINDIQQHADIKCLQISAGQIEQWDSRLVLLLLKLSDHFRAEGIEVELTQLPEGVQEFLQLATAVPERTDARKDSYRASFFEKIGNETLAIVAETRHFLSFIGAACLSMGRLFVGKAQFRASDFWLIVQECGPNALPIVALISFLIGLILAFVGVMQLKLFGAEIYIANLVGLGMAREMGGMMTAIIMAGRTGAAFAAQLGSMQVNEEIDAFKTMGINPIDFLVLPRMLAMIFMMPLLCLYADLMGIFGGFFVGVGLMDLSFIEYFEQTRNGVSLNDFAVGLFKSAIFGVLVALTGCMKGIQCGRSSSAVGQAATAAVVTGIVSIVVADSVLTIIYDQLGI